MGERRPQTLANHTRLDPAFHFFMAPFGLALFFAAAAHAFRHPHGETIWMALTGLLLAMTVFLVRVYSLKVQDRVIRMEERLRLSILLPEPLRSRIGELTEGQLIAIRFASDAEVPALVAQVLSQKLAAKDIKKAITTWRPDYYRV